MQQAKIRSRFLVAWVVAAVLALPLAVQADEGFWLFNRIPKEAIKKRMASS